MIDLDLPPLILSILASGNARRTGPRADPATFEAWLKARGYPAHEAVLSFEARYGGLALFETDPDAPALVVGAYACLADGVYKGHEADLVPVMFAWDDVIYALDGEGRGFTRAAMVEGQSRHAARDGRQLVTQAILWRRLMGLAGTLSNIEGAVGAERAAELGLEPIAEASIGGEGEGEGGGEGEGEGEGERWWGDGDRLVVEIQRGNGYAGPRTYLTR